MRVGGVPLPDSPGMVPSGWNSAEIAERAYDDLAEGTCVNLGIGLPTLILDVARRRPRDVIFHSENGVLGIRGLGPDDDPDPDLIDAGKNAAAIVAGASFFGHAESFAMIRGGHLDTAVLGAYEVAANGDFANWTTRPFMGEALVSPGRSAPAVGGAVDLAAGAKSIVVLLKQVVRNGRLRLVNECALPLTGRGCIARVYCDLGVLEPAGNCFVVRERAAGVSIDQLSALFEGSGVSIDFAA